MTKVKVLARNWGIYVQSAVVGTFQKVGGIDTFTLGFKDEQTDTTDFDSEGYSTHIVSGRSHDIKIEGSFVEDVLTGDRDAGQELIESLATKLGPDSIDKFRLMAPSGKTTEYDVSASLSDQGGGLKDKTKWGAALTVSGKPLEIPDTDTAIYIATT
jgi:predicted secreted protein